MPHRRCDDDQCNQIYSAHRATSRFCTDACKMRYHYKLKRARTLLGEDRTTTPPAATTSITDAWSTLGTLAGEYDSYAARMRSGASVAYRCEYPPCAKAFQAPSRQHHCSPRCRDLDAGRQA
jgi:hypothetical protein